MKKYTVLSSFSSYPPRLLEHTPSGFSSYSHLSFTFSDFFFYLSIKFMDYINVYFTLIMCQTLFWALQRHDNEQNRQETLFS